MSDSGKDNVYGKWKTALPKTAEGEEVKLGYRVVTTTTNDNDKHVDEMIGTLSQPGRNDVVLGHDISLPEGLYRIDFSAKIYLNEQVPFPGNDGVYKLITSNGQRRGQSTGMILNASITGYSGFVHYQSDGVHTFDLILHNSHDRADVVEISFIDVFATKIENAHRLIGD